MGCRTSLRGVTWCSDFFVLLIDNITDNMDKAL